MEQLPSSAFTKDTGFFQPQFNPARPEGQHTAELREAPFVMGDPRRTVRRDVRGNVVDKIARMIFVRKGMKLVEAPKGSGNLYFFGSNQPAGRVERTDKGLEFKMGEQHKTYVPPLPREAQYHQILAEMQAEIEQLKAGQPVDNLKQLQDKIANAEARAIDAEKRAEAAEKKTKVAIEEASNAIKEMREHYEGTKSADGTQPKEAPKVQR